MTYIAESVVSTATPYVTIGGGSILVLGGIARGVSKSFTRTPPNSSGIRTHHDRPYSRGGNILRRVGIPVGKKEGDYYRDAEPGTHWHLPKSRGVSWLGTHWRFTDVVPGNIDNSATGRQHHLGATVVWRVAPKRDESRNEIVYKRRGEPVEYRRLIADAIYKAGESRVGGVQEDIEGALVTVVTRTCKAGLREIMQGHQDSHQITDKDTSTALKAIKGDDLLDYGVELGEVLVQDTHYTDRMPEAINGLLLPTDLTEAIRAYREQGLHAAVDPMTSA